MKTYIIAMLTTALFGCEKFRPDLPILKEPDPAPAPAPPPPATTTRKTTVSIVGNEFHINGVPTFKDRTWQGYKIQGLLPNSRMVQGIFDDRNQETVSRWSYPDTKTWDAERNTNEFIAAMPDWKKYGMLAFTLNLQGGSPYGYSSTQPWHNSAINSDGSIDPNFQNRLKKILNKADELGMVVILGYFYFGQDERIKDEAAVIRAVDNVTEFILKEGYTNVIIEINNECNIKYDHAILQPSRIHELVERVKNKSLNGRRLLVTTSYSGGTIPGQNVVRASDYILLHGNGVSDPLRIKDMVTKTKAISGFNNKPIVFNEDDHYNFDKPMNNFVAATQSYASWGFFDFRREGESFNEGFQSIPVNWSISSSRKTAFFNKVKEITGL